MKLNIRKPIVFFDIEATGVDVVKEHIVELCYIKLYPDGKEVAKTMRIRPTDSLGNQIHIPQEASDVHGIYDDDVNDKPAFKDIAESLYHDVFEGCDLAGYNSNYYDIPLLVEEFLRAGVKVDFSDARCIDVCVIYKMMNPRTLTAAYRQYCHKNLEDAHSALADTRATLDVLEAQLDCHPDVLSNDVDALCQYSTHNRNVDYSGRMVYDEQGREVFNFGKYKGRLVAEVLKADPGYFQWIMMGDFSLHTKQMLSKIRLRERKKTN